MTFGWVRETPVFYQMRGGLPDEDVAASSFPAEVIISSEFLYHCDSRYVHFDDGDIVFDCENGTARYGLVAFEHHGEHEDGEPIATFLARRRV